MPDDAPSDDAGLLEHARGYPFPRSGGSFLFVNGRVWDLVSFDAASWENCAVRTDEGVRSVGEFIQSIGCTPPLPLGDYVAVIASGSNASPDRLRAKFGGGGDDQVFPVVKARLGDFVSVYAAHFTSYGAIAATLQGCPGAVSEAFVNYLSPDQLAAMHATESLGSHYAFAEIQDLDLALEPGGNLPRAGFYATLGGCVHVEGSFIALSEIATENCPYGTRDQTEMLELAFRLLGDGGTVESFILRLVRDPGFRANMTAALRETAHPFRPGSRLVIYTNGP